MKYFATILLILLAFAYNGCGGGHGLTWTLDGQTHSFSWREVQ